MNATSLACSWLSGLFPTDSLRQDNGSVLGGKLRAANVVLFGNVIACTLVHRDKLLCGPKSKRLCIISTLVPCPKLSSIAGEVEE